MEELLALLKRFMITWEQNVVLGDHRWQSENMRAMRRFAKGLSKAFSRFDLNYSDLWDAEVRQQMHVLSSELVQFVTPNIRLLSVQDNEAMVAHGRMAYELTRGLLSHLEPRDALKLTRKAADEE